METIFTKEEKAKLEELKEYVKKNLPPNMTLTLLHIQKKEKALIDSAFWAYDEKLLPVAKIIDLILGMK